MNFLKKFASVLINAVGILSGVGPLINQYLPAKVATVEGKVIDSATQIVSVLLTAEGMIAAINTDPNAKTGADKLAAARPFVKQLILGSEVVAGHHVANDALLTSGVDDIISGWVQILNSLKEPDIKVVQPQDLKPA